MNPLLDLATHPVIGHRGAAGSAPENTLPSLHLALEQGAEALEFDVRLAADGTPVLMHDDTLDRTTPTTGRVTGRTAMELAALDAGHRFSSDGGRTFPWRGRGVGIPSLAEVLDRLLTVPLLIELKTVAVAEPVLSLLLARDARERVVLASFEQAALEPFHRAGFRTGASRRGILALWLRSKLGISAPNRPDCLYAVPERYQDRLPVPTKGFIRAARRSGRPVHVWTVDDPNRAAELWKQGVGGIITNCPARIRAERDRLFPTEGRS